MLRLGSGTGVGEGGLGLGLLAACQPVGSLLCSDLVTDHGHGGHHLHLCSCRFSCPLPGAPCLSDPSWSL